MSDVYIKSCLSTVKLALESCVTYCKWSV